MSKDKAERPAPEKDDGKPDGALDDSALEGISGGDLPISSSRAPRYISNADFHRRFRLVNGQWVER